MLYDETTESLRINEKESSKAMQKLPNWVVANKFPAFYDTESLTAIEQTARLYGATNTLIENYNTFISIVDEALANFLEEYQHSNEVHEVSVRQLIQDFFDSVETALQLQNSRITAIENTFGSNIENAINKAIRNGSLNIALTLDEATEQLLLTISDTGNEEIYYDENTETLYHI
jgi:hypothetical protein